MAHRSLTHGVAAAIVLIGVATLLGWWLDIELLKRGIGDGVAMNPATAVGFILFGASLWIIRAEPLSRDRRRLAGTLAAVVALVALARLGGYLLGVEVGIDQVLFAGQLDDPAWGRPNRMAPNTALGFLFAAIAVLLIDVETAKGRRPSQVLSIATGAIAVLGLLDYAAALSPRRAPSMIPMALNTAATFLLCSIALVAARPGRGLLAALAAWPLRRRVNIGFGSALLVLVLVSVVTAWSNVRAAAAFDERRATNERRLALLRLSQQVDEAVRGERGFLLTGDTVFLQPYLAVRDSVEPVLASIMRRYAALPADTPRVAALAGLVREGVGMLSRTIGHARAGDQRTAVAIVRQGRGKRLIDAVHDTIQSLVHRDEARAIQADLEARAADRVSIVTSIGAGVLAVVVLLGAIQSINRDITRRHQAEAAVRESESRLFQILEAIPVGVFVVDAGGRSYYANRASKAILGEGIDRDVVADRLAERYQVFVAGTTDPFPPDRIPFGEALAGRIVRPTADAEVHRSGHVVPIEYSAAPVLDAAGRVAFAICVFSDITDRRELEKLRDNLVHMLVHDLRSPLTAIRAYLDLVKLDAGQLDADLQDSIDQASAAAIQMTEMVSDLIDVSRLESGAMPLTKSAVDLTTLTQEALASVGADAQRGTVRFDRPSHPVIASCDAGVIRRVIANLVANAIKFTPATGTVRIGLEARPSGVRLRVSDTGPGIAPEHHATIFEKFGQVETARQGGKRSSGLGLTFCKLAVETHGGSIGVESALGAGSTFWFELPAS